MKSKFLLLLIFLPLVSFSQAKDSKKNAQDESDLARVAILNFKNNTGDKNLVWITTNLPENIYESMQKRFEFIRTNPKKAQAIADKINPGNRKFRKHEILQIAKKSKSDIVIYGDFFLNKKTNQLEFTAHVFHVEEQKDIGVAKESSPIDNTIFDKIDKISQKIIDDIYQYALRVQERETAEAKKKKVRIMVLVPSWKTAEEKAKAEAELQAMKFYMSKKYDAEFMTIFEFYKKKNIPKKEQKKVNKYAKQKKTKKIIAWLDSKGVKNAFIILVQKNDVSITPVVEGKTKQASTYKANAKPEEKFKVFVTVSKQANIPPKEEKKVVLDKKTLRQGPTTIGVLWRTAVMPGWGHLYANQKRGYAYIGVWSAAVVATGTSATLYFINKKKYKDAQSDFDAKYNAYRDSKRALTATSYFLAGIYPFTYLELAISGDMFLTKKKTKADFIDEIWRNALIPGWGQMAAKRNSGYFYYGIWATSAITTGIFTIQYLDARDNYKNTGIDFDYFYDRYNTSKKQLSASFFIFGASYTAPLLDSLFHGPLKSKNTSFVGQLWRNLVAPGWGQISSGKERGSYYLSAWTVSSSFLAWSYFHKQERKKEKASKSTLDNADALFVGSIIAVGATYLTAIVDTILFSGSSSKTMSKFQFGKWKAATAFLPDQNGVRTRVGLFRTFN